MFMGIPKLFRKRFKIFRKMVAVMLSVFIFAGVVPIYAESESSSAGLLKVVQVIGGAHHNLALKDDGTVWAWGENSSGQLGDGTTIQRTSPIQVSGLTGTTIVATGSWHCTSLLEDGTVWAWGSNYYGQLGDGARIARALYSIGIFGTPPAVIATETDTEIVLTYSVIGGTLYYEIEIDGTLIDNGKNTTYSYPISIPDSLPTYRVRSVNYNGPGLWSVNKPSSVSLGTITAKSIQALWETNVNPAGTLYKIAAFNTNNILVKENEWLNSLSDIITGLSPNTSYIIKIKAKNEDGVETGWHEIGSTTTLEAISGGAVYDGQNQLVSVELSNGKKLEYQYDENGNLTKVIIVN